jgi:Flp pilus assembly protein TadG
MFKNKEERGQSLVEVALTLPLLLLIVMGILDLGRAYLTYITLSDAAAEGAAYAAIYPADTAQAIARAAYSSDGLVVLSPDMVSVDWNGTGAGNPITVTVEYEYQLLTPFISELVPGGTILMRATVAQPIIGDGL